jgi:anti-anti-sigma factor
MEGVERLRAEWRDLVAERQPARLVIDLAEVTFIDSMGLSLIVSAYHWQAAHGGVVRVANAGPMARRVLAITGIDSIVEVAEGAENGAAE